MTDEYREARRELILLAAARCFARSGFHLTSMDDVIAEAGLSAGAVYGYYRGKDELIEATVGRALELVGASLTEVLGGPEPPRSPDELLERALGVTQDLTARFGFDPARIAVQAWGEALRDPRVHELVRGAFQRFQAGLRAVVRRWQRDGRLPADADPGAVAQVLFSLVPGYMIQRLVLGDVDAGGYVAALRALTAPVPARA